MLDIVESRAPGAARGIRAMASPGQGTSARRSLHAQLLQLQAAAGNRAVTGLIARSRVSRPVVQRCGPVACDCSAEEGHPRPPSVSREASRSTIQRLGEQFTSGTEPEPLSSTASGEPDLSMGSRGPSVAALQEQLNALEPAPDPPLDPDGIFGGLTAEAVQAFQESRGLEGDGIVGPVTRNALAAAGPQADTPLAAVGGLSPPAAVPETADTPCPPYTDAETNGPHPGGRLDFGEGGQRSDTALLFDFAPGKSEVTETHRRFLKEVTERFKLDDRASPIDRITVMVGFTDCVGFAAGKEVSKDINAGIRKQRALAIKIAFRDAGAAFVNVPAEPQAGGAKGGPGDNATPEGRALNRSVQIGLERTAPAPPELPGPAGGGPGAGLCSIGLPLMPQLIGEKSDEWELTSHVSASVEAVIGGGTGTEFTLKDTKSGRRYPAIFVGFSGGLSTPLEFQISIPSASPFTTPSPVCPDEFNGPAAIVTKFSVMPIPGIMDRGVMEGDILLDTPTKPAGIDIGSEQVGIGVSTGIAEGTFFVIETPF
jgi:hypothetical protein